MAYFGKDCQYVWVGTTGDVDPNQSFSCHCERSAAISRNDQRTLDVLLPLHIKEYVMKRQPAVYLLTNRPDGTLYTGVTGDLPRRIWQHKNKVIKGFSTKYNLTRLVYFELFEDMYEAISREKQIKAGSRKAKISLIESSNPEWKDLYAKVCA